jgi:cytochrome c oxidase cbb3-type subunit 4
MDAGTLRGLFTVVMLVLFIAICFWAWSGRRKTTFDAAARMPLEPDELEEIDRSNHQ